MNARHGAQMIARSLAHLPRADDDWSTRFPKENWPTFEAMADQFPSSHAWVKPVRYDYAGFFHAAVEASELEDGITLLAVPQPLSFESSITVEYVGEGVSEDGCFFHAFLFQGRGFDVYIWIEDDLNRTWLVWRGCEDDYVRAEVLLRMFEGRTLAHLG